MLPGLWPRMRDLFTSGFQHIAWAMAYIYYTVRLLPADHPYLNPANKGRFGIRHVIAEAARNLIFDRKHIDQILIFGVLITGLVLLFAQFALLIVAVITQQPAFAEVDFPTISEMFKVNPEIGAEQDLSFILLDHIFGLQNVFDSCISDMDTKCQNLEGNDIATPQGYPYPFHKALHQLLSFYSYGIFFVGVIVILYFVTVVIGETATTGSPFGQRYNKTWVPLRIILFFALITPLSGQNAGINIAQRITFEAAHLGSIFATNSWHLFNETLADAYQTETENILAMGKNNKQIATPNFPEIGDLLKFMYIVKACQFTEQNVRPKGYLPKNGIQPYLIRSQPFFPLGEIDKPNHIEFIKAGTSYEDARKHVNQGTIVIRFGTHHDDPEDNPKTNPQQYQVHSTYTAQVKPVCGEILLPNSSGNEAVSAKMNEMYYDLIRDLWKDPGITNVARCIAYSDTETDPDEPCPENIINPVIYTLRFYEDRIKTDLKAMIDEASDENNEWNTSEKLMTKGWAGAAIWYNRIAALNGEVTSSIFNVPKPSKNPFVMELIASKKRLDSENVNTADMFSLSTKDSVPIGEETLGDNDIAIRLASTYDFLNNGGLFETPNTQPTQNIFIDVVNWIFGSAGIFDMYENTDVNPLAQLSAIGKGLIDASVRNIAVGIPGSLLAKGLEGASGEAAKTIAEFATKMGMATLGMGIIMYYILPLMPFIYFFFAVSGWVKSIFEAIVAMPLWALGHISSWDGPGMAGPGAQSGYFLIFEIFLRPIMILFGLIASISIFSASVHVLNDIFGLVIDNTMGADRTAEITGEAQGTNRRGPIDIFFFTAMYVVICYMLGLASFKLIDAIPNAILRWMGQTTKTFQEEAGDPADQVMQKTYKGLTFATNQVKGGMLAHMV